MLLQPDPAICCLPSTVLLPVLCSTTGGCGWSGWKSATPLWCLPCDLHPFMALLSSAQASSAASGPLRDGDRRLLQALWGAFIGMQTSLASLTMGEHIALAVHRWLQREGRRPDVVGHLIFSSFIPFINTRAVLLSEADWAHLNRAGSRSKCSRMLLLGRQAHERSICTVHPGLSTWVSDKPLQGQQTAYAL